MMHRLLHFTLDLFDSVPEPQASAATPLAAKPGQNSVNRQKNQNLEPNNPLAQVQRAQAAIEKIVNSLPVQTLQTVQQALAPATFRHPRATREVLLAGVVVAYEFKRGKRRTIGFSVGPDGLAVSAPKWVPLYEIDKAVNEKSAWILKKLQESRERTQSLESSRIDWKDGASFRFLGEPVTVVLDPRHAFGGVGAELKGSETGSPSGLSGLSLHIGLPHSALPEQIRDAVQAWLMRQAKRIFTERMNHFTPIVGVKWRKLSLSSAGTRWGSASADGSIRLNWRLIHLRQPVIDYVVVHELSHLRVMDHSPLFWSTVKEVVPDYAELRIQLKAEPVPRW